MAKKKKNKNKYVPKYYTGGRLDMRSGGRVKLAHGGEPQESTYQDREGNWVPGGEQAYAEAWGAWNAQHNNDQGPGGGSEDNEPIPIDEMTEAQKLAEFNRRRSIRNIEAGDLAGSIAAGETPMVPDLDVATIGDESGAAPVGTTIDPLTGKIVMPDRAGPAASTIGTGEDTIYSQGQKVDTMGVHTATAPDKFQASTFDAQLAGQITDYDPAQGILSEGAQAKVDEIRELSGPAVAAQVEQSIIDSSKAQNVEGLLSSGAFAKEVIGATSQISETPQAERQQREAITGDSATGAAAQILNTVNYEAAQQRIVTGQAASGAAATMIAQTANIPEPIAAAIVQDPASVEAQVDNEPVEVQAAIAALPTEALVSSQMESLLGGMEEGEVPLWAKPAVDAVNQNLAQRGLSVSTVGRDSLFNAIIQTAFPMAQGNAQALQARAAQNLSNEQAANLQQATQEQQLRLQNLSNRQTAESQSAQMSQEMRTLQSQFDQQAVMTTAQQQQQTAIQNLQNRQQSAVLNAQNQQAMNALNLGNQQQMEMANLQLEAQAEGANQAALNQERLAEMQIAADFLAKNAAFAQDMNKANLSTDQQMRLANLQSLNQAGAENLNAAQQTELANLNALMDTNINNANLANQMGLAQLNVDQQTAMQHATANMQLDMTKFNFDQQTELANSKFVQTSALQNLDNQQQVVLQNATALASLDMATADSRQRLAINNAQAFLQMDVANLDSSRQTTLLKMQQEQQRMLSDQSAVNTTRQINSASENQTNQFLSNLASQFSLQNMAVKNQQEQVNAQFLNAANAADAGRIHEVNRTNAAILNETEKLRAQMEYNRDLAHMQDEQAIRNGNVTWRRQLNTIDTAAQNQANQFTAQQAFGLTNSAMSFLWQELRDQADYDFRWSDNTATRKVNAMIAAAGADKDAAKYWSENFRTASTQINSLFGYGYGS